MDSNRLRLDAAGGGLQGGRQTASWKPANSGSLPSSRDESCLKRWQMIDWRNDKGKWSTRVTLRIDGQFLDELVGVGHVGLQVGAGSEAEVLLGQMNHDGIDLDAVDGERREGVV